MLLQEPEEEPQDQEKAGEGRSFQLCWRYLRGPAPPQVHFSFPLITSWVWWLRFYHITGPFYHSTLWTSHECRPKGSLIPFPGVLVWGAGAQSLEQPCQDKVKTGRPGMGQEPSVDRSKEDVGRGRVQGEQGPGWSCPDSPASAFPQLISLLVSREP